MKKFQFFLIATIFALSAFSVIGQNEIISDREKDKLFKELTKVQKSLGDSVYIDSLIKKSLFYREKDLTLGSELIKAALIKTEELYGKNNELYFDAAHEYGTCLYMKGEYKLSLQLNEQNLIKKKLYFDTLNYSLLRSEINIASNLLALEKYNEFEKKVNDLIDKINNVDFYDPRMRVPFLTYSNYLLRNCKSSRNVYQG